MLLDLYRFRSRQPTLKVRRSALLRAHLRRASHRLFPSVKRILDVVLATLLVLATLPLLVAVAVAIKLDSPGPVFFRQVRIGRKGQAFTLWKFRSMSVDAESERRHLEHESAMSGGIRFKMASDPRITRVGRWIRRLSIDELPQLFNIIAGDMSLVGPRPPIPREVAGYDLTARRRLDPVPGLTCIWQVSGRSQIPFRQQVEMDIDYGHRQSLTLDLILLARTVPAVLLARGAC